jgi:hypothetical protein
MGGRVSHLPESEAWGQVERLGNSGHSRADTVPRG